MLRYGVKEYGKSWDNIAFLIPGRTTRQCRERWYRALDPRLHTGKWLSDEDERLRIGYALFGNNWRKASSIVGTRSDLGCIHRWRRRQVAAVEDLQLKAPSIASEQWSKDEIEALDKIMSLVRGKAPRFECSWVRLAKAMPTNRTPNQIQEQVNRTLRKGKWLPDEDERLRIAYLQERSSWSRISAIVGTRCNTQCRTRWFIVQRHSVDHKSEED